MFVVTWNEQHTVYIYFNSILMASINLVWTRQRCHWSAALGAKPGTRKYREQKEAAAAAAAAGHSSQSCSAGEPVRFPHGFPVVSAGETWSGDGGKLPVVGRYPAVSGETSYPDRVRLSPAGLPGEVRWPPGPGRGSSGEDILLTPLKKVTGVVVFKSVMKHQYIFGLIGRR